MCVSHRLIAPQRPEIHLGGTSLAACHAAVLLNKCAHDAKIALALSRHTCMIFEVVAKYLNLHILTQNLSSSRKPSLTIGVVDVAVPLASDHPGRHDAQRLIQCPQPGPSLVRPSVCLHQEHREDLAVYNVEAVE